MRTDLDYIDSLGGRGFEKYIYKFFNIDPMFKAKLTPASHDYGFDVITKSKSTGKTFGIQCKWTRGNSIGYRAIEEAVCARKYYKTDYAFVFTNGLFTAHAQKGAKRTKVGLTDRDILRIIHKYHYKDIKDYLAKHLNYQMNTELDGNSYLQLLAMEKLSGYKNLDEVIYNLILNELNNNFTDKQDKKYLDLYNSMLEPKLNK